MNKSYMENLFLYHLPKSSKVFLPEWDAHLRCDHFTIETCMRYIVMAKEPLAHAACRYAMEERQGREAYQFLLELACGLLSNMPGEPEIFGQIKQAWQQKRSENEALKEAFDPIMRSLFQDTKRIRSNHLQGVTGASYFSATEKLINLKRDHNVLIIGAGQFGTMLAHNIAKRTDGLFICNRSEKALEPLVEKLNDKLTILPFSAEIERAISDMDHVLIALPSFADQAINDAIINGWQSKQEYTGHLVHYCEYIDEASRWRKLPNSFALEDVLCLQSVQTEKREKAFEAAYQAVKEYSHKRYLQPVGIACNHYASQTGNA